MQDLREIQLRPMRHDDAEAAAALIRAAFTAQAVATDPPPSAIRESADSVAASLAAPGQGGLVACAGDSIAGCVLWQVQPRGLYLGRLAVDPAHRGRGIAAALVAAVEAQARQLALPRLLLSTRLVLAANRRLFARCGFTETTRHAHPGYAYPTFVDMEKPVEGPA